MRKSLSKNITIDDCDPETFETFVRYLYSNNFSALDQFVSEGNAATQSSDDRNSGVFTSANPGSRSPALLQLLEMSHKYQIERLRLCCERELCKCIQVGDVSMLLCQAHLHKAKAFEWQCVEFIKNHVAKVSQTDGFGTLCWEWPQVSLKVTLYLKCASKKTVAATMQKHEYTRL